MNIQVHAETYRETEPRTLKSGETLKQYLVDVTIGGSRRAVRASEVWNGRFYVFGLAIRFSSGAKVWPGSAIYWTETGVVNHIRPNIDKRGVFSLVGFAEDFVGKAVRSQHNAVA